MLSVVLCAIATGTRALSRYVYFYLHHRLARVAGDVRVDDDGDGTLLEALSSTFCTCASAPRRRSGGARRTRSASDVRAAARIFIGRIGGDADLALEREGCAGGRSVVTGASSPVSGPPPARSPAPQATVVSTNGRRQAAWRTRIWSVAAKATPACQTTLRAVSARRKAVWIQGAGSRPIHLVCQDQQPARAIGAANRPTLPRPTANERGNETAHGARSNGDPAAGQELDLTSLRWTAWR